MAQSACLARFGSLLMVFAWAGPGWAAQPSETLLPATTKAFVSTQNVDQVREKFRQTQLGELVNDPIMQPFIDDVRAQIGTKLEKAGKRLGLKWADMVGVSGGEVALAVVQPDPKDKLSHATVLIVDITGKRQQTDALLAKVDANQQANRATRSDVKLGGVNMVVYTQPLPAGGKVPERAFYFIQDEMLVVADHQSVAAEIAGRFGGDGRGSLATLGGFKAAMARNDEAAKGMPYQVRWFIEPFGYADTSRAMQGGRRKRGQDVLKILKEQGFTAVQGVGGYVFFATGDEDVLHRTFLHAPTVAREAADKSKDKYNLAMRMLDFPNSAQPTDLDPQKWVLPDLASYLTFNWRMKEAFDYSKTLVDSVAGEDGLFDEIWLGLKTDPNGPMIDIRRELVDQLGERATILADVKTPIDLKSERLIALVEVKSPEIVAKALAKAFQNDPAAKKRMVGEQIIWELTQEEQIAEETELLIEGAGFVSKEEPGAEEEEDAIEPVLPNMALTVFDGHLVVSTHVNFIIEFIEQSGKGESLAQTPDFKRVDAAIKRLGSDKDSFRFFTRTDQSYRATYELVKQNKLPQAETLLARLLNALVTTRGIGSAREQAIDGSKLPPYESVMKYFGPGGLFVQTENDGLLLVGCLLKKEAAVPQAAAPQAEPTTAAPSAAQPGDAEPTEAE
ncbi:MAG: hypothetical protein WD872_13610 [Pirellulaceae bacterium]